MKPDAGLSTANEEILKDWFSVESDLDNLKIHREFKPMNMYTIDK